MFERAITLDPAYAEAYAALSATYLLEWIWQWSQGPQPLHRAFTLAQTATALNDTVALAHMVLANVYLWKKQHALALTEAERTLALDPNNAEGYATLAEILTWVGQPEEALPWVEKALRLNPHYPANYLWIIGHIYRSLGDYETAIAAQRRTLDHNPGHIGAHIELVVNYSALGQGHEARAEAATVLCINPQFSVETLRKRLPFKEENVAEGYLATLQQAGLP
jgi:tetratricopeptide (TPR) repeat protein